MNLENKYLVIDSAKLINFFRKKSSANQFLVKIVERQSFGKVKVDVFYNDKSCPYYSANYIGTTIVDADDIIEADAELYEKNMYCYEVQTTNGRCRLTCSKDEYNKLNSLQTDEEKVKFVNELFVENYGKPNAVKFITAFVTKEKSVRIGNLDGIFMDF